MLPTRRTRGGANEIGDVDQDGNRVSRVNLDTVTVGEDGDGEVTRDGKLVVTDGLPGARRNSMPDKVLSKVREASVPSGKKEAAACGATSVCNGGGDVWAEPREMMWDSGCSYTLLTAEDGRMWDGSRDKTVRFTGFVGEQRVGIGGGLMYALLKGVGGHGADGDSGASTY